VDGVLAAAEHGLDNAIDHCAPVSACVIGPDGQVPPHPQSAHDPVGKPAPAGERPVNHGWYVSQVAHDHGLAGRDHGKAVSEVARSDQGKPAPAGERPVSEVARSDQGKPGSPGQGE
jgi:hypothetical protein